MAEKKKSTKQALTEKLEKKTKVFAKQKDKDATDPARRLAQKRLKQTQRRLKKVTVQEAKAEAAAAKKKKD